MKIVHFIVNPVAGKGKPLITEQYLLKYFGKKDFSIVVKYSEYKGHAKLLTRQSIKQKADIIVACGGDGTINEIASCLVHTTIVLGIIPIGSGNGLARNLKISTNIEKAINTIKKNNITAIDVGEINDNYFFSNTGIGFAANTILNFESSRNRRLLTYLIAGIKSMWSYKNIVSYTIEVNGKQETICPFLIFISNTNVMGYNFSMTRKAVLNDGFLDMVVINKLNRLKIFYLAFLFLFGVEHTMREYSYRMIKNTTSAFEGKNSETVFQIDGDLKTIKKNILQIKIFNKSLNVISPFGNKK